MKIGLDYGGVISFDPNGWASAVKQARLVGHAIFLISHAHGGEDTAKRRKFAEVTGATDLTFDDLGPYAEEEIRGRKARLLKEHGIELMIEDDMGRCTAMEMSNPDCIFLRVPQSKWWFGQEFLRSLVSWYDA